MRVKTLFINIKLETDTVRATQPEVANHKIEHLTGLANTQIALDLWSDTACQRPASPPKREHIASRVRPEWTAPVVQKWLRKSTNGLDSNSVIS